MQTFHIVRLTGDGGFFLASKDFGRAFFFLFFFEVEISQSTVAQQAETTEMTETNETNCMWDKWVNASCIRQDGSID